MKKIFLFIVVLSAVTAFAQEKTSSSYSAQPYQKMDFGGAYSSNMTNAAKGAPPAVPAAMQDKQKAVHINNNASSVPSIKHNGKEFTLKESNTQDLGTEKRTTNTFLENKKGGSKIIVEDTVYRNGKSPMPSTYDLMSHPQIQDERNPKDIAVAGENYNKDTWESTVINVQERNDSTRREIRIENVLEDKLQQEINHVRELQGLELRKGTYINNRVEEFEQK